MLLRLTSTRSSGLPSLLFHSLSSGLWTQYRPIQNSVPIILGLDPMDPLQFNSKPEMLVVGARILTAGGPRSGRPPESVAKNIKGTIKDPITWKRARCFITRTLFQQQLTLVLQSATFLVGSPFRDSLRSFDQGFVCPSPSCCSYHWSEFFRRTPGARGTDL